MISSHRLTEFVHEVLRMHNDETEEKTMWEFYLHRVFDMSFKDFMDSLPTGTEQQFTESDLAETIANSVDMLNGFNPCQSLS